MNILFPRNHWIAFLYLAGAILVTMAIDGLTDWAWPFDNFFYFGVTYIMVWYIYVYWPRKGTEGRHSRNFGIFALSFGVLGLLSMAAMVIFHLSNYDWETLAIDGIGSAMFLSIGALNIWGASKFPQRPENSN